MIFAPLVGVLLLFPAPQKTHPNPIAPSRQRGGPVPGTLSQAVVTNTDLSENSGTFTPQIIPFLRGFFHYKFINHPFWGFSPYFWKHPNTVTKKTQFASFFFFRIVFVVCSNWWHIWRDQFVFLDLLRFSFSEVFLQFKQTNKQTRKHETLSPFNNPKKNMLTHHISTFFCWETSLPCPASTPPKQNTEKHTQLINSLRCQTWALADCYPVYPSRCWPLVWSFKVEGSWSGSFW